MAAAPPSVQPLRSKFSIALICQSNVNRSMAAHKALQDARISCCSYGVGSKVRMPGESMFHSLTYDFGTPYREIYDDMYARNPEQFAKLLEMIARDREVKTAPEQWQQEKRHFDIIVCYETRVFEIVCADISDRRSPAGLGRPCHVLNLDTTDNQAEAKVAAGLTLELVEALYAAPDWEESLSEVLDEYEARNNKEVLHMVYFY